MKTVNVIVPASTSNLGSGFDTLGLAVELPLGVSADLTDRPGIAVDPLSSNAATAEALVREAAEPFLPSGCGLNVRILNDIPVGRGFGASAALRVAVIAAVKKLAGLDTSRDRLLQDGYALEHHPDNVSPSLFGGFTVSGFVNGRVRCSAFELDDRLKLVALFPEFELPTAEARKVLPSSYSRADTAHALNRAALVTAAFARRDYEALRGVFDDRVHQPYREKLIPQLSAVIRAGEQAGALGGFLSGAGSGIICLALQNEHEIANAMKRELPASTVRILRVQNTGLRYVT